ncbi:MAG: substrate-binding domain-containing protein, partial [Planctomycetota bacterium]
MRRVFVATLGGLCMLSFSGCGEPESGAPSQDGPKKLVVAVIPKSTGAEFWETVERGARDAAKEENVDMKWEGPLTETELAEQNRIIESMINLEVDGIALAPLNPQAMRKRVESAVEADIPVVIFDSAVDGDAHTSFVATRNEGGGELGAKHLIELLGGKKKARV